MSALLEARCLSRTYGTGDAQVTAVHDVDLTVARGEFVAVMGPSGCGKSTLLNLLAGLDRPSAGEVWLDGARVDLLNETALAQLRRRRVGFVFQFFNLLPTLTACENVELPLLLVGQRRRQARRTATRLLEDLGLGDKTRSAPNELSGGQQQRVALARALANAPDVVMGDEPTGSLDSTSTSEVLGLLRAAHARGQTLLLATHDARVAAAADRVVTMRDGRLTHDRAMDPPRRVTLPFDAGEP